MVAFFSWALNLCVLFPQLCESGLLQYLLSAARETGEHFYLAFILLPLKSVLYLSSPYFHFGHIFPQYLKKANSQLYKVL